MASTRRKFDSLADALSARPEDVRELRVTQGPLPALPPQVFAMTGLETLVVERVGLQVLPPDIGKLTALKRLGLRDNALGALPPEVGLLGRLNDIDLSGNPGLDVPPELFALKANNASYPDGLVPDVTTLVRAIAPPSGSPPLAESEGAWIMSAFGIAPASDAMAFAFATRGIGALPGPFSLSGFDGARATRTTFASLFGFDDYGQAPFPAVCLGDDGRGAELWVSIADGALLSLHHDDLVEIAVETREQLRRSGRDGPGELMSELVSSGSLIDLRTLLFLQVELPKLGVTDWGAFTRGKPPPPLRLAIQRLVCLGMSMPPGHLKAAPRWKRSASRFLKPVIAG